MSDPSERDQPFSTMTGRFAPGWPGIPPRWTSSAKTAVGTSLRAASRVWFTISHGILNEVYYPRIDQACLRDFGLMVTDGRDFVSEEKRDTISRLAWLAPGVPGFRIVNTCRYGRYEITKEVLSDPIRDVVLQRIHFRPLSGVVSDYHLFALLAPHLANAGSHNSAWIGDFKGTRMLMAERAGTHLAVASVPGWTAASAGFVGVSDGWQDLTANGLMRSRYTRADDGNVALAGEIDLAASDGSVVMAMAFGESAAEAGHRARASLFDGFAAARRLFLDDWTAWQARLQPVAADRSGELGRVSAAILRCHEDKRVPGAIIASLSVPWGDSKSDDDLGGYHLVWPRDLVESAGGLLAAGNEADAIRVLGYLRVTQNPDGSWPQNMWVSGTPYWHGIQLDETAFPILLIDLIRQHGSSGADLNSYWPMVRQAATFLVRNGPVTDQDRWEEDAGLSPFTVAVQVAALVVAADLADAAAEPLVARYLRDTADAWNESLDTCTYVRDTALARQLGVDGYYVRIAPPEMADAASPAGGFVPIKNRPWPESRMPAIEMVSPDALALVRFGLRAPDDPRIVNTIKVVDALLAVELPCGRVWRRYNGDGYGEHDSGRPFDGVGHGRPWPLLTGERGHYELAAGNLAGARRLLATLEACANDGGLLPEQVWDAADVPARELHRGGPTGSAMPLVWAHAEHLKLRRSLDDGRVFDLPLPAQQRYAIGRTRARHVCWRFNHRVRRIAAPRILRIETLVPCLVHWSVDGWLTCQDTTSADAGLGLHVVDLPTRELPAGTSVVFTFFWPEAARWEGTDFQVTIQDTPGTRESTKASAREPVASA